MKQVKDSKLSIRYNLEIYNYEKKYHIIKFSISKNFHWLLIRFVNFSLFKKSIVSFYLSTHILIWLFNSFFFFFLNRYYRPSTIDAPLDWCLRSSGSSLFSRKSIASISLRTHHDKPLHFPFGNTGIFAPWLNSLSTLHGYIAVIFHSSFFSPIFFSHFLLFLLLFELSFRKSMKNNSRRRVSS